jgi:flagellar biosynthesis protein FliR
MEVISLISNKFALFLIVFTRVSGIFSMTPVFGSKNLPARVKIGLALCIAALLFPVIAATNQTTVPETLLPFVFLIITEFIIGLIIGFASFLVFAAVQMAGGMMDNAIGFSIVSVLDPQSGFQIPILGTFKYLLAILLFLGTNGHHVILAALSESFQRIPLGAAFLQESVMQHIVQMFVAAFAFALKVALPILVTLFLVDVAFGIMARTVPQMNVFIVGMPAKIVVGLFMLSLVLPIYVTIVQIGFTGMYSDLYRLLTLIGQ